MKIRSGFVSNSSSTSFVIYGKEIEDVESFMKEIEDNLSAELREKLQNFDEYDKVEELAEFLGKENNLGTLSVGKRPGVVLIEGIDWEKMQLNNNSRSRRLV